MIPSFSLRLELHNAQVELEALRAEGRGMVWENERRTQASAPPCYTESDFNALAARIRATKLEVTDALVKEIAG